MSVFPLLVIARAFRPLLLLLLLCLLDRLRRRIAGRLYLRYRRCRLPVEFCRFGLKFDGYAKKMVAVRVLAHLLRPTPCLCRQASLVIGLLSQPGWHGHDGATPPNEV